LSKENIKKNTVIIIFIWLERK